MDSRSPIPPEASELPEEDTPSGKPPLQLSRIVGQALAGLLGAGAGGLLGVVVALIYLSAAKIHLDAGLGFVVMSIPLGAAVCCPLGVYLTASSRGQRVSFFATYGGGLLVGLAVVLDILFPETIRSSFSDTVLLVFVFSGPVLSFLVAIAGSILTRRYAVEPSSRSPSGPRQETPGRRPSAIALLMSSGLGLGMARFAPGAWASLLPVALFVSGQLLSVPHPYLLAAMLLLAAVFAAATVRWGDEVRAYWGNERRTPLVSDAVAGQSLALVGAFSLISACLVFVVARLLALAKPWPMRRLQRLPGSWGLLADDLVAGVIAALCGTVMKLTR